MATSTLSPIDHAAAQEFEYYGSTLTTNTALKAVCLIFAALIGLLGWQIVRLSNAVVAHKPLIIRVDDVGKAEAIDYKYLSYEPQDAEIRYFLNQFIVCFYSREHRTIRDYYPVALRFLSEKTFSTVTEQDQKAHWIPKFITSADDDATVQVRNISLDYGQKPVYRALVEYIKIYTNSTGTETKRESFTDNLYFKIDPSMAARDNEMVRTNPLGFSIFSFHPDQAFAK